MGGGSSNHGARTSDRTMSKGPPLHTVARPDCPVCHEGGQIRYSGPRDEIYNAPGEWTYRTCHSCQTLWLDPLPADECFDLIYPAAYFTHSQPRDLFRPGAGLLARLRFGAKLEILRRVYGYQTSTPQPAARAVAAILVRFPGLCRRVGYGIRFVPAGPGTLVDVGCGNGEYLLAMSRLGWTVKGVEPDSVAASLARHAGISVEQKPLQSVSFDPQGCGAITLHHVLEHFADPAGCLQQLSRALRPGGVLVSFSPNPLSLLSRCFRRFWRGLEPPRHFTLLSPKALADIAKRLGLQASVWTTSRMSEALAQESVGLWRGSRAYEARWPYRLFSMSCSSLLLAAKDVGEEVVFVAQKPLAARSEP